MKRFKKHTISYTIYLCPHKSVPMQIQAPVSVVLLFKVLSTMFMYQIYGTIHSLIQQHLHNACISPTCLSHIKLIQCIELLLQATHAAETNFSLVEKGLFHRSPLCSLFVYWLAPLYQPKCVHLHTPGSQVSDTGL